MYILKTFAGNHLTLKIIFLSIFYQLSNKKSIENFNEYW